VKETTPTCGDEHHDGLEAWQGTRAAPVKLDEVVFLPGVLAAGVR